MLSLNLMLLYVCSESLVLWTPWPANRLVDSTHVLPTEPFLLFSVNGTHEIRNIAELFMGDLQHVVAEH